MHDRQMREIKGKGRTRDPANPPPMPLEPGREGRRDGGESHEMRRERRGDEIVSRRALDPFWLERHRRELLTRWLGRELIERKYRERHDEEQPADARRDAPIGADAVG
jgi:hypothetical protein